MAVLGEIRKRPWILISFVALGLVAFVVNPQSIEKLMAKDPNVLGKVNGEDITRDDVDEQVMGLMQSGQNQNQNPAALQEQAWQGAVEAKLIRQEFAKMGLNLTEEVFWNQIQYDPMFAQNPQFKDEKGNFKVTEIKKQIEDLKSNPEAYNNWLKTRKVMETRIMARLFLGSATQGIAANQTEVKELLKQRDSQANFDYVLVDYAKFDKTNPTKVSQEDLAAYIQKRPISFKRDASRSLGLVHFKALPTPADELVSKTAIDKLNAGPGENFQNTKSDSMFVMVNSDAQFSPEYRGLQAQPQELKGFLAGASAGQSFGPYKVENKYYVVSKLLGKKASDSILSKHILISYAGNKANQDPSIKRTKDQAKTLADSILTAVKGNAAQFAACLKFSADGSKTQEGQVGWTTSTQPKFVGPFQKFVENNPKGAFGLVESEFGFHIINVLDKKSGSSAYKVANLVKEIKASAQTTNKVYSQATSFVQGQEGQTFNTFQNAAKKANYNFSAQDNLTRFAPSIQGLGTEKDQDILAWAFRKDAKVGATNIFQTSTGDQIVVHVKGIQDAGLADPESVRPQLEPVVKNQVLAKKITEKMGAVSNLAQVAKTFGSTVQQGKISLLNPMLGTGAEPKVAGAAFGVAKGQVSKAIHGNAGVYIIKNNGITTNKAPETDLKAIAKQLAQESGRMFSQRFLMGLKAKANIKDFRIEVYNQAQKQ
jgi:peptidyl-prolyl cis-trans isomerase D